MPTREFIWSLRWPSLWAYRGVGFGICRRLLFQLCLSNPPDSWPQAWAKPSGGSPESTRVDGLTLIMACRSTQRAEAARKDLYKELDAYIARLRARPGCDGHADVFRILSTVFDFAAQMAKQSVITRLLKIPGIDIV